MPPTEYLRHRKTNSESYDTGHFSSGSESLFRGLCSNTLSVKINHLRWLVLTWVPVGVCPGGGDIYFQFLMISHSFNTCGCFSFRNSNRLVYSRILESSFSVADIFILYSLLNRKPSLEVSRRISILSYLSVQILSLSSESFPEAV
jgi:hypothetical protein